MANEGEENPKIPSELFSCFADSTAAIANQKYQEALTILEQGLNQIYDPDEIDGLYLLDNVRALAGILGYTLRQAYGDDWGGSIGVPEIPKKEIRCSFCGKAPEEVMKIIAGAKGYICDGCIGICNEVLAMEAGSG